MSRAISNGLLALVATALAFGAAEALLVWTPLGDPYGWCNTPTLQERISELGEKNPSEWRILGLGDSFTVFRERDGGNFLRIAERQALRAGFPVRLVNLGQTAPVSGTTRATSNATGPWCTPTPWSWRSIWATTCSPTGSRRWSVPRRRLRPTRSRPSPGGTSSTGISATARSS